MKTKLLIFLLVFSGIILMNSGAKAQQGSWIQKAYFGGAGRVGAAGFSIGTKGYIGTGCLDINNPDSTSKDFWEWDQLTNVWTQKADFGGTERYGAVGFSIGTKGYIGTGCLDIDTPILSKDFWEWNQASNIWTQKADFGGPQSFFAVGFSIGTKGYIGTGVDSSYKYCEDFWEYNPLVDSWIKKASFGGGAIAFATGFSIGGKGYIATGIDANNGISNKFWEWDQPTNVWTQKADFSGNGRVGVVGFSIGTKGYMGTGCWDINNPGSVSKDFWEWDQASNVWTQKADFGGPQRFFAVGFSIGTKGYIGTGTNDSIVFLDFWEFDPDGTGVNEVDISNLFSVYPNPSGGRVNVMINKFGNRSVPQAGLKISSLDVYNIQGEKVVQSAIQLNGTLSNQEIDLSLQPHGVYFVNIKTEQGMVTKKIIIKK